MYSAPTCSAATVEASAAWLVQGLRAYGVLLRLGARRRHYWLPAVGFFALFQHAASPPVVGGPLGRSCTGNRSL